MINPAREDCHRLPFVFLLIFILLASIARAEPHYTAIFGQSCGLCHVGPTGRGMRSLYGSQFFGPTYLPVKPVTFEFLERIKPQLSESVIIGADLRTIWLSENTQIDTTEAGLSAPLSTNTGTISQMEGYLYLNLRPSDNFSLYYSQGVAQSSGRFEMYGLVEGLPLHSFIKAGQFQENFGWAFADHTSFVRTGLFGSYDGTIIGIPSPPHYGVGAEVGLKPWKFDVSASFTNAQTSYPQARDKQKRWFARAQFQQGIEMLGPQFTAGGSWYHAPYKAADPEYPFASPRLLRDEAWGGFGGLGWEGLEGTLGCTNGFGFLASSAMFEYDRRAHVNPLAAGQSPVTAAYSTGVLSTMIQPGIWLIGQYDWMDLGVPEMPDPQAERTTLGLQIFPLPWVEVSPRYRLINNAAAALRNQRQFELQAHFFF
ncbi:hypothetical protein KKH27_08830 [bacterium]|nr:hypothetical protein [bacterium]